MSKVGSMEEWARVLDVLPKGRPGDVRMEPAAYVIGETQFTLFEVILKKGVTPKLGERIYIGGEVGQREKIERIRSRVSLGELTSAAQSELKSAITAIIKDREKEFVAFFNKSGAITIRQHQLELIPGIGKKHLDQIITRREQKPFESLDEIRRTIHFDVLDALVQRIIEELKGTSKYYLFVRPPSRFERR